MAKSPILERLAEMVKKKTKHIFVTGKGGVGKSAVAAAIAQRHANQGQKTLLVELGYQSFYQDYFDLETVKYGPTTLMNFQVSLWSGPECLKEYVLHLIKIESLYRLFFENPVTKTLIGVAPALAELAILGKITSGPRRVGPALDYDVIVVDAFATGHFLALLKAPLGMAEAVKFGPMGEQSRSIQKVLMDPELSEYVVVSFPEELPVTEGIELAEGIYNLVGQKPKHILNRYVQIPEEALLEAPEMPQFQNYLKSLSDRQKSLMEILKKQGEVYCLPFVFDHNPKEVVGRLAQELSL